MRRTKTIEREVSYVTCDFCGKDTQRNKRCEGCGKDVCPTCGTWWHVHPFTDDDHGDYPPMACFVCHDMATKMGVVTLKILRDADEKVDEVIKEWKTKCKK